MGTAIDFSQKGSRIQRSTAQTKCYGALCSVVLFGQMTLYGTLSVLPAAGNAAWWLAGLMMIPALALGRILGWCLPQGADLPRMLQKGLGKKGAAVAGLLYGLVLWLDIQFALSGLTELTAAFVIEDGGVWQLAPWGAAAAWAAVCLGRELGAARCCYLLRWLLAAVLMGCVAGALLMGHGANLFPWQYESLQKDVAAWTNWLGALWPVVLTGFASVGARAGAGRMNGWVLLSVASVLLLFFGYAFVLPPAHWQSPMTWGERMVIFLRATSYPILWELFLIFKMTVLFLCLAGEASLAGRLLNQMVIRRVSPGVWAAVMLAGAVPLAASHTGWCQRALEASGPWRLPLALLPVIAGGVGWRLKERRGEGSA